MHLTYLDGPEQEVREFLTCLGYFLYFILYIDIVIYKMDTCKHKFLCYTVLFSIKTLLNNLKSEEIINICKHVYITKPNNTYLL